MPQNIKNAANYSQTKFDTLIPELVDPADIVNAFKMYHYGVDNYNGSVPPNSNSIESHFITITASVANLNKIPIAGSTVSENAPFVIINKDSSSSPLTNGFLWVDNDDIQSPTTISGVAILSSSAPAQPYHGMVWVDQDNAVEATIFANEFDTLTPTSQIAVNTSFNSLYNLINSSSTSLYNFINSSSTQSLQDFINASSQYVSKSGTETVINKTFINPIIIGLASASIVSASSINTSFLNTSLLSASTINSSTVSASTITSLSVSSSVVNASQLTSNFISTSFMRSTTASVSGNQAISSFLNRNIYISTSAPTTEGNNGDIWIRYS